MLNFEDFKKAVSDRYDTNYGLKCQPFCDIEKYKENNKEGYDFVLQNYNKLIIEKEERLTDLYELYKCCFEHNKILFKYVSNPFLSPSIKNIELKYEANCLITNIKNLFISFMMNSTNDKVAVIKYCDNFINNNFEKDGGVFLNLNTIINNCLFIPC